MTTFVVPCRRGLTRDVGWPNPNFYNFYYLVTRLCCSGAVYWLLVLLNQKKRQRSCAVVTLIGLARITKRLDPKPVELNLVLEAF